MPSLKLSNPFHRGAARPSLKERVAQLKVVAGRVMHRRPLAQPPIETPSLTGAADQRQPTGGVVVAPTQAPDPIFAAIEAHEAAQHAFKRTVNPADKAWVAAHDGDTSPEAMDLAQEAYSRADAAETMAWNSLFLVTPTTQAGLVALILHAREFVSEQDGDGLISLGDIFTALARGVRTVPVASEKV